VSRNATLLTSYSSGRVIVNDRISVRAAQVRKMSRPSEYATAKLRRLGLRESEAVNPSHVASNHLLACFG
jgi:hypothetical protein